MKEPVDHILRPSLPWRASNEGAITECGFDASKVKPLTRAEFFQRLRTGTLWAASFKSFPQATAVSKSESNIVSRELDASLMASRRSRYRSSSRRGEKPPLARATKLGPEC